METITGQQLLQRAVRIADCLRASGLKSGDVLAIFCESRAEVVWLTVGALLVGVTVAFIDADLDERKQKKSIQTQKSLIL